MVPQNCSLKRILWYFLLEVFFIKVVLVAGRAGSGKTYLGEKIVEIAKSKNIRALQTEYSKYIKMYASEILGYDGSRENKPRKFLQDTGSFIRETLDDAHFFTRRMLEDFRIYEHYFDIVVVSDVRLIRELEDIKNSKYQDVVTIKVENSNSVYSLSEEEKNHITEKELADYLDFDYIVNNEFDMLNALAKRVVEGEK